MNCGSTDAEILRDDRLRGFLAWKGVLVVFSFWDWIIKRSSHRLSLS